MTSQVAAARTLLALHRAPAGFIVPNAWDAGSAVVLAAAGFPAIATTSAGIAFSLGKPDYGVANRDLAVTREEMIARIAQVVAASPVPVTADLEAGFGDDPRTVADTIRLAIAAGAAGGNIEDVGANPNALIDEGLAVERIAAARAAGGDHFVLNARTDAAMMPEAGGLEEAIRRGNRYLAAGADCVFVPGVGDLASARTLVAELNGPLNLVAGLTPMEGGLRTLLDAGVQRISVGGSIARQRSAWSAAPPRNSGATGPSPMRRARSRRASSTPCSPPAQRPEQARRNMSRHIHRRSGPVSPPALHRAREPMVSRVVHGGPGVVIEGREGGQKPLPGGSKVIEKAAVFP